MIILREKFFPTVILLALFFIFATTGSKAATVKWSQRPSMNPQDGYSFSSETQVPSQVADDFFCENGAPIVGLRWWGSYWDTTYQGQSYYPYPNSDSWGDPAQNPPQAMISHFIISFYADVPAGQGVPPWSHPGSLLYAETIPLDRVRVKESKYGTINRSSSTQTVFQYDALLPMPFEQEAGNIYWLSIQAVDPNGNPLQWGWQESMDHWNDNAVQQGFSQNGWWDLLPGEDMAFVLKPVPIPAPLILFGSGLLGLIGLRRRQGNNKPLKLKNLRRLCL